MMSANKKPNYRPRVWKNNNESEPEIYDFKKINGEWKISRRDFITAFATLTTFLAGCSEDIEPIIDENGKIIMAIESNKLRSHITVICDIMFSHNGKFLASADNKFVKLWDVAEGKVIWSYNQPLGEERVSVSFSPDDGFLAFTTDSSVKLLDVTSGEIIRSFRGERPITFSPDGRLLASGSATESVIIWDVESGEAVQVTEPVEVCERGVTDSIAFHPNGNLLVSTRGSSIIDQANRDYGIIVWDIATGKKIYILSGEGPAFFSPDGKYLFAGNEQLTEDKNKPFSKIVREFDFYIKALSSDGRFIAGYGSTSVEGVKVLDLLTNKIIFTLTSANPWNSFSSVAFNSKSKIVASGGEGVVRLWDLEKGMFLTILFDPKATEVGNSASLFQFTDDYGAKFTYVLPAVPLADELLRIPRESTCICNYVAGSYKPPSSSGCVGIVCICDFVFR